MEWPFHCYYETLQLEAWSLKSKLRITAAHCVTVSVSRSRAHTSPDSDLDTQTYICLLCTDCLVIEVSKPIKLSCIYRVCRSLHLLFLVSQFRSVCSQPPISLCYFKLCTISSLKTSSYSHIGRGSTRWRGIPVLQVCIWWVCSHGTCLTHGISVSHCYVEHGRTFDGTWTFIMSEFLSYYVISLFHRYQRPTTSSKTCSWIVTLFHCLFNVSSLLSLLSGGHLKSRSSMLTLVVILPSSSIQRSRELVCVNYWTSCTQCLNELFKQGKAGEMWDIEWSVIDRWSTHPGFIEVLSYSLVRFTGCWSWLSIQAVAQDIEAALAKFQPSARSNMIILFSAHSLPMSVVNRSRVYERGKRRTLDHQRMLPQLRLTLVFLQLGMELHRAESLNGCPVFIRALADITAQHLRDYSTTKIGLTSVQMELRCPGCKNATCQWLMIRYLRAVSL